MKQQVKVWLTEYGVRQLIKHPGEVLAASCFHIPGIDMSAQGWVKLGPVEVALPDPQSLVPGAIANLERGMAEIYNEAGEKVAMLEKVKAELLALPAPTPQQPDLLVEKMSPGEHLSASGAKCMYTGIRAFMRSGLNEELLVAQADLWISPENVYILNVASRGGVAAWKLSEQDNIPENGTGNWCSFQGIWPDDFREVDFPTIYVMHSGNHFQLSEGAANYIDAGAKL